MLSPEVLIQLRFLLLRIHKQHMYIPTLDILMIVMRIFDVRRFSQIKSYFQIRGVFYVFAILQKRFNEIIPFSQYIHHFFQVLPPVCKVFFSCQFDKRNQENGIFIIFVFVSSLKRFRFDYCLIGCDQIIEKSSRPYKYPLS